MEKKLVGEKKQKKHTEEPVLHWLLAFFVYLSYATLIGVGHLRDFIGKVFNSSRYSDKTFKDGYAVLFKSWESFFTRRLYHRIQDAWNRPIASSPGCHIEVMERVSSDGGVSYEVTGNTISCLNVGSYNYLGFADDWKETCRDDVMKSVDTCPLSMTSSRMDLGTLALHKELEEIVARFVGKEAAIVYAMGYGTNSSTIPAIMGPESLIISDALNHTSIVNGSRASPSNIRVFRHNDVAHLEEVLREAIIKGQPKHHRPWKKILVMVEGIYSMEGDICKLDEVVAVCKKYKAYVYVDEAHSIGALGRTGRGVCEQMGVDPKDVDILMGTFTKSFSGMGGYIAGSHDMIASLKARSAGLLYHNSMSPIITQQVITAFRVIMGEDGTTVGQQKITALRENSNFFREGMRKIGVQVVGDDDSPIIPMMIFLPAKISAFSRECLKRGLAVVVVGFPATSVVMSRARFCISAGLKREDIVKALKIIEEVVTLINLRYNKSILG